MGLFIRQNDNRSQLQERLAAEMQERAKQKAKIDEADRPDGVTDSQYMKNTKQTTSMAWLWVLIALVLIGITIWLTVLSTKA